MDYTKNCLKKVLHYYLIKEIGKGATGKIYLAVDEKRDELVAVKAVPMTYINKENGMIKIAKEMKNLNKLQNNNIIKIKNNVTTKNNFYIFMEYCNGGSLLDYKNYYEKKNKTTLNELFIQKIMRQITDGLEYMHSKNIVHRDIKLDNILLNFNKYTNLIIKRKLPTEVNYDKISLNDAFTIKISDLGYSKELTSTDLGSTILGTPINMSPDVIGNMKGETKKYNTSVDLWSLGSITYQLLTGKPPFVGTDDEIMKHVMEGTYTLPSSLVVSVEILTFINGLLQFYPEKRLNWEKIKSHPFLTKKIDNFTFIKLNSLKQGDKKEYELNTKNPDNLLWILFNSKGLNVNIDKINVNDIKDNKIKESINNNAVINEEIKKEIEMERKKIEEEKKRLKKEKEDAEKLKKEAETIKNEVISMQKNIEKEKEKINEEEKKKKELEEQLKKEGELNQQKNEEIKKKIDEYQKKINEIEKNKNENDMKLKDAEKLLKNADKMEKEADKQLKALTQQKETAEKKRKEEEEQLKEKEKQILDEKKKAEEELEKIKEKQKKEEENCKLKKEELKKQIEEMNKKKSDLEKEADKQKLEENEDLKKKEQNIEELKKKLEEIEKENKKQIEQHENEKKELEKKVKDQVEFLKKSLGKKDEKKDNEIINDKNDFELKDEDEKDENLKINDTQEKKDDDDDDEFKDWEVFTGEQALSINLGDKNDQKNLLDEYEIIEKYDEKENEVVQSKKVEV